MGKGPLLKMWGLSKTQNYSCSTSPTYVVNINPTYDEMPRHYLKKRPCAVDGFQSQVGQIVPSLGLSKELKFIHVIIF